LPDSTPDASVVPDVVVRAISELPAALAALAALEEAGGSVH
jgi:hypothetical protein